MLVQAQNPSLEGRLLERRYRLTRLLGAGGMGEVYEALDERLSRRIAVKLLRQEITRNSDVCSRFLQEARAAAAIKHPGVVTIYEFGQAEDGLLFMVMELLEGETLHDRIAARPLPETEAAKILAAVAQALQAAHSAGVVHRDLKPANIFLSHTPTGADVKVVDFGIAKLSDGLRSSTTQTGMVFGSPAYMSPEQIRDASRVDARTDIYSLGVTTYELFSGRRPYDGTVVSVISSILTTDPPPIRLYWPTIPEALETLIMRMLAREPGDRPVSMLHVAHAFQHLVSTGILRSDRHVAASVREIDEHRTQSNESTQPLQAHKVPTARQVTVPMVAMAPAREREPDNTLVPTINDTAASMTAGASQQPCSLVQPVDAVAALIAVLPPPMHAHADVLRAFLGTLSTSAARVAEGVLRLVGVRIEGAAAYEFFALFLASAPALETPVGRLGTQTFLHYAKPMEGYLSALDPSKRKVVIAIVNSTEIGAGVRSKIVDYRRRYDAIVVPLHVNELLLAARRNALAEVFQDRLTDFHARGDPYDPYYSSGPIRDPTRFYGLKREINQITSAIEDRHSVLLVCGVPGSGKSSIINRVEYDLSGLRLVRVSYRQLAEQTPKAFAEEIVAALLTGTRAACAVPDTESVPAARDSSSPPLTVIFDVDQPLRRRILSAARVAGLAARGVRERLVLVLEDADALIEPLSDPSASESDRACAQELWAALSKCVDESLLSVVVTSFVGFVLTQRAIARWLNPLQDLARLIRLCPLGQIETARLIDEIGRENDIHFEPAAAEEVWRLCGGNIDLTRRLCSWSLLVARREGVWHPLSRISIRVRTVQTAAAEIVGIEGTLGAFHPWFRENERRILQIVADRRPASPQVLKALLAREVSPEACSSAIGRLQNLGLLEQADGHMRMPIPLVARWVAHHVERTPAEIRDARRRKIRNVTFGLAVTALCVGAYIAWFRTHTIRTEPVTLEDCKYLALYPERGTQDERLSFVIWRECAASATPKKLALVPRMGTAARIGDQLSGMADVMPCAPSNDCRAVEVPVTLMWSADGQYDFQLRLQDRALLDLSIIDDPFARLKRTFDGAVKVASALPALIGILLAFYSDVLASVRHAISTLRGSSDTAATTTKTE